MHDFHNQSFHNQVDFNGFTDDHSQSFLDFHGFVDGQSFHDFHIYEACFGDQVKVKVGAQVTVEVKARVMVMAKVEAVAEAMARAWNYSHIQT